MAHTKEPHDWERQFHVRRCARGFMHYTGYIRRTLWEKP